MKQRCKPISLLIEVLRSRGCSIVEENLQDYHFNELSLKMKLKGNSKLTDISIINIDTLAENKFYCTCHWSMVEVEIEEQKIK